MSEPQEIHKDSGKKKVKGEGLFFVSVVLALIIFGTLLFLIYKESSFFHTFALFDSQGIVALKERSLMVVVTLLMLIVVIPVFAFTFFVVWKYRAAKNPKHYNPDWDHSEIIESIWWGIPCMIIAVLSLIIWQSSHDLDPYKPLDSNVKPITIQVVALDWKWLFIYPEQGIATVNLVEFPAGTPINFRITADAPMNSFWIPQLGGQIYAMPGMSTQLHLEAFKPGSYNGLSANMSGTGFSGMKFIAQSVSQADFNNWVATVQQATSSLTEDEYNTLLVPSQDNPVALYASIDKNLYNETVMKFMTPESSSTSAMPGMDMENQ